MAAQGVRRRELIGSPDRARAGGARSSQGVRESPWLREIRRLDAERDCRRIVFLDTFREFPFDTTRALERRRRCSGAAPVAAG
jgi:hypothetical protein